VYIEMLNFQEFVLRTSLQSPFFPQSLSGTHLGFATVTPISKNFIRKKKKEEVYAHRCIAEAVPAKEQSSSEVCVCIQNHL